MPSALPMTIRQEIVRRRLDGQELTQVALRAGPLVPLRPADLAKFRAARSRRPEPALLELWPADRQRRRSWPGPVPLKRDTPVGAPRSSGSNWHASWAWTWSALPAARTLQDAFRAAQVSTRRSGPRNRGREPAPHATRLHEVWQVDAVEKTRLANGRLASWLTVVDEATGAMLDAELSPPGAVAGDHRRLRPASCFAGSLAAGGCPSGCGSTTAIPGARPATCRPNWRCGWWGWGSSRDWNPARQPWLNPKVERANGVTQRWVEVGTCPDHATLEERLAWACRLQREWYPAVAGRSRLEAYPDLTRVLRPYSVGDRSEPLGVEPGGRVSRRSVLETSGRPLWHDLAVQPQPLPGPSPCGPGGAGPVRSRRPALGGQRRRGPPADEVPRCGIEPATHPGPGRQPPPSPSQEETPLGDHQ